MGETPNYSLLVKLLEFGFGHCFVWALPPPLLESGPGQKWKDAVAAHEGAAAQACGPRAGGDTRPAPRGRPLVRTAAQCSGGPAGTVLNPQCSSKLVLN